MNRDEAYNLGYRHGSDSSGPDTRPLGMIQGGERGAYFRGYAKGSDDRDIRLSSGKGHVPRPEWMTDAQYEAANTLYRRSPDGSRDRYDFFTRFQQHGVCGDMYAAINWCGMHVGIEPDGYTHT